MDRFGPTRKVSKKSVLISRWTTFLSWIGPIKMTIPTHSQSQDLTVRYLSCTKWRKILITALLWIVNSGSIRVTRTFMQSYDRSVVASQAKCMFWLLTALKDDLFPERICNVLFVIRFEDFERGVWSPMANIWERSAQNNLLLWMKQSHNVVDITVEIVI